MFQQPQQINNNLPVPMDRLMEENFFQTAPQVPMSFGFDTLPQMQQFNQLVGGYLIKVVQDNSKRNMMRFFTANYLSQGRWSNPQFQSAFLAVSDYAYLLMNQSPNNPEAAILQSATVVASCLAAIYTQQFPVLAQGLTQQQVAELSNLLQQYQQISQSIQQMRQQMQGGWNQQPQQQFQGGWNQPQQQFQQPRGNWASGNVQQQQQFQSGWGQQTQQSGWNQQPQQPQGGWNQQTQQSGWGQQSQGGWNQPQQPSWQQPQQQHSTVEAVVNRGDDRNAYTPAVNVVAKTEPAKVVGGMDAILEEWGGETHARHGHYKPQTTSGDYVPQPEPVSVVVESKPTRMTVIELLDKPGVFVPLDLDKVSFVNKMGFISTDPDRMWDQLVLDTGEEVRPAHNSGWTLTFDPENPYGTYYDPAKYAKFHIRKINPDGSMVVREKIIQIDGEVKSTMEYLNHEIRKSNDYRLADDVVVAEVPWSVLEKNTPLDLLHYEKQRDIQANLEEGQEVVELKSIIFELDKDCHTFQEAELHYHKEKVCNAVPDTLVVEYNYRSVTPLVLEKPQLSKMSELRQCEDLCELATLLREGNMDSLLYHTLNNRLTEAVNDAVAYNLGYGGGLTIDNFVNDIVSLGEELKGEGHYTLWNKLNKERYSSLVNPLIQVLIGADQSKYLHDIIEVTPKEGRHEYKNVISLVDNNVVVHLPGIFGPEFSTTEAQQITNEMNPELLNAIRASFGRHHKNDNKFPIRHHYLVDALGNVLEIYRGWLVSGSMLVRRVLDV